MKKTFILFNLLILCLSIQAQFILKTDLFRRRERADTTEEFPNWGDSIKDSTLIIITKDSLIRIDNIYKDSYKLNKILDRSDGIDLSDGDKWDGIVWVAIDDDGIKVKLIVMKYQSGAILITITYGNLEYRYQGRPYKPIYPITI
jgi:hypothetical protein